MSYNKKNSRHKQNNDSKIDNPDIIEFHDKLKKAYYNPSIPINKILQDFGISPNTLYRYVNKYNWKKRINKSIKSDKAASSSKSHHTGRITTIEQLYKAIEFHVKNLNMTKSSLKNSAYKQADCEKSARILSSLIRSLDKLIAMENAKNNKSANPNQMTTNHDSNSTKQQEYATKNLRSKIEEKLKKFIDK